VPATIHNILTVDVEEYFQVENFKGVVPRERWPARGGRAARSTRGILDILDASAARATFFIVGWVAEQFPDLVREIAARGHEIGSHGFSHLPIFDMDPTSFRADLRRSKKALEAAAGVEVRGYRAPTFSIVERTLWALDILYDEGFAYDSSIFPVHHDRYGIPSAERFIHMRATPAGRRILELPPMTARFAGCNIPMGGGAYFRLLPVEAFVYTLRRLNAQGKPGVVYLHPWEFDPGQPRLAGKWTSRFRHYHNLHATAGKLRRLLRSGRFTTAADALQTHDVGGRNP
jgi:polysaccharide deacetylase family protein (PEP-CTERM system associated)